MPWLVPLMLAALPEVSVALAPGVVCLEERALVERLERAGLTVTAGRSTRLHVDLRLAGAAILVRGFRQGSTMERTVPARVDECVSVERVVAALIQSWAQIIQPLAEPDQAASSQRSTTVDAGVAGLRGLTAGTGVEAPPARSRRASDSVSRAPSEASGSVGREAGRLGSAGPAPESGVAPVGSPRMPSDDQTERFDDVRAVDVNPTPESATRAPSADQTGRLKGPRAVSVGRTLESAVAPMGSPRTPSADQTDRLEGSRAASVRRTPESAVAPVGSPRPSSADQTDRAEARAASLARIPESAVAPVGSPRTPSADRLEEPVAVSVGRTPQSAADPANSPLAASPRSEQPGAASVSPTVDAVQVSSASANPTPGLAPARANAPLAASADRTPRSEESQSSPVGPVPDAAPASSVRVASADQPRVQADPLVRAAGAPSDAARLTSVPAAVTARLLLDIFLGGGGVIGPTASVTGAGVLGVTFMPGRFGVAADLGLESQRSGRVDPALVVSDSQWLSLRGVVQFEPTPRLLLRASVGLRGFRLTATSSGVLEAGTQTVLSFGGVAGGEVAFRLVGRLFMQLSLLGSLRFRTDRFVVEGLGPVLALNPGAVGLFGGLSWRGVGE